MGVLLAVLLPRGGLQGEGEVQFVGRGLRGEICKYICELLREYCVIFVR